MLLTVRPCPRPPRLLCARRPRCGHGSHVGGGGSGQGGSRRSGGGGTGIGAGGGASAGSGGGSPAATAGDNNVLFQTFLYMYIIFTLAMGVGPPYISVGLQRYMYYPLRGGGIIKNTSSWYSILV